MSAKAPVSKFQGLFSKAAEDSPAQEPAVGRIERPADVAVPQPVEFETRTAPEALPREGRRGVKHHRAEQATPLRLPGRPPGKRSDPAWKQFSVLLQRDTQRKAVDILRDADDGRDLSGLVQSLLESWIKKQS